ncbi:MAG: lipoprotein [candidate division WOR-3 bacterium]
MKKYFLIIVSLVMVAGCIGGMGQGCGGCISSVVQKEIEKQTGVELGGGMSEEEIRNYRLSDSDVEKYIKDYPKIAEKYEEFGKSVDRTPAGPMKGVTIMAGSEKMLADLRVMGWNPPEKFFAVHYAVWTGIAYNSMKVGMEEMPGDLGEARKQMEEMLNDPNIPPDQKAEIRKGLKEMEGAQDEMKKQLREIEKGNPEIEHNAKVVERHMDDLMEMFEKIS